MIEYAKAYYPTVYNDFTQASPGSMFIDMASYVGDVLSFYLDNQLQETSSQVKKTTDTYNKLVKIAENKLLKDNENKSYKIEIFIICNTDNKKI